MTHHSTTESIIRSAKTKIPAVHTIYLKGRRIRRYSQGRWQAKIVGRPISFKDVLYLHISFSEFVPSNETFGLDYVIQTRFGRATIQILAMNIEKFLMYLNEIVDIDITILLGLENKEEIEM